MKFRLSLIIFITLISLFFFYYFYFYNQILYFEVGIINKHILRKYNITSIENYLLFSSKFDSTEITSHWLEKPYCLMKFKFDSNFNLSKIIDFNRYSSVGFSKLTEYTYDSHENMLTSEKYEEFRYNENTKKEDKLYGSFPEITLYNYSFDTQQNVINKIAWTENDYETYIYSDNKPIEKIITHTTNSMNTFHKFNYNEIGNLIEEINYYPTCKLNKLHKHLYFESGSITNECECYPNNSINYKIYYKYDDYNNLTSLIKEDRNKKLISKKFLTHNYLLKSTVIEDYDNNKFLKREVIYYDNRNLIFKKEIFLHGTNHPFEIQSYIFK